MQPSMGRRGIANFFRCSEAGSGVAVLEFKSKCHLIEFRLSRVLMARSGAKARPHDCRRHCQPSRD